MDEKACHYSGYDYGGVLWQGFNNFYDSYFLPKLDWNKWLQNG